MSKAVTIGYSEIGTLKKIKDLVNYGGILIELYEDKNQQPYISTFLKNPPGQAYVGINDGLLHLFECGKADIRDLFDYSPALFIEIEADGQQKLFYRADLEIELLYEECRISYTYEKTSSDHRPQASE